MNWVDKRDPPLHVTVPGGLYLFRNTFFLLIAAFGFFVLPVLGVIPRSPEAAALLRVLGTAFGLLMLVLALSGWLTGCGLLQHKPWAQLRAIVSAVLGLVNFPFGTVIEIYALLVRSQQPAIDYFAPQQPA